MSSSTPPASLAIPTQSSIIVSARSDPSSIDGLLQSCILDPFLPIALHASISDSVNRYVTPECQWGGDPSRSLSATYDAFVSAALLGRAYALLAGDRRDSPTSYLGDLEEEDYIGQDWSNAFGREAGFQIDDMKQQKKELLRAKFEDQALPCDGELTNSDENLTLSTFSMLPAELRVQILQHYEDRLRQRRRLWSIISSTFIKALFSGTDPEPLARYSIGILVLTCGQALSRTRRLIGKGTHWTWFWDEVDNLEEFWTWPHLKQAIMKTEDLPRDTWNVPALMESDPQWGTMNESPEYVSKEVLHILDAARGHLQKGAKDLNSKEITAAWLPQLDPEENHAMDANTIELPPPFSTIIDSNDASMHA